MKKMACLFLFVFSIFFETTIIEAKEMLMPGDVVVFGRPAGGPDSETYSFQTMLAYYQNVGRKVGIYNSLFGGGLKTWDDTDYPMGERFFWYHIEIVLSATPADSIKKEGAVTVVLRPIQKNPKFYINIGATIERFKAMGSGGYSIPIHIADLHKVLKDGTNWIANQPDLFDRWAAMGGVDFNNVQLPAAVQYSPYVNGPSRDDIDIWGHTDIESALFPMRDHDCSSRTMWSLIYGWYHGGGGERARQLFLNNLANVNAIDAMAPGQVAWWLVSRGLVQIILP